MITALPDAATAERSVLGAALSDENARDVVLDRLTPEMFTVSTHRAVLDALCALDAKGAPTDVVSVSEHLKGGPAEDLDLPGLIMDCPTTDDASVGWWAKIIADAYTIRRLAGIGSEIIELARTTSDPSEALVHAEALLQDATPTSSGSTIPVAEAATIALDELTNPERSPGLSTGLEALDRRLGGGLHDGRLYLIAARPGMGKTALGHQIAAASARAGRPALVVTLEMSATEVAQRLLTVEAKIDHSVFNTGTDNTEHLAKLDAAVGRIAAWPLELIDSTSATVPMIRAAARQIRSTHGDLGVIVIDYLQLMVQGGADNRQALVAEVSRSL
jgi:replicative DNA helicase